MLDHLRIELASHDQEMVDGATGKIVAFIANRHDHVPIAIPLPVTSEQFDGEISQRVHPRVINVRAADTELLAQLRQVQLPEGVEVTIKP